VLYYYYKEENMKKRLLALVMTMIMATAMLAGCGNNAANEGTTNSGSETSETVESGETDFGEITVSPTYVGPENPEITITWQPAPFHSMFSSNPARVEYLEGVMMDWAVAHPGVGVNIVETTTDINEAMAKTLVQLTAGGDVPDVTSIDSFIFPRFAQYAQPIGDVLSENGIETSDFFPYVQDVVQPGDDVLGLWYTTDVRVMFYNTELVPEAPTTTAELIEVGEALAADGKTPLLYTATTETALTDVIFPVFWGQGGTLVDENGAPNFGEGENRDYMIKTLEFVKETIDTGVSPERVLTIAGDGFAADVGTGNVGMFIAGNWQAKNQRDVLGELFDENWKVAPVPMIEGADRTSTAGGWVSTVFTKDEEKRVLCADLIAYVYGTDEGMEGWCSVGGYLPPRETVFESESFSTDVFSESFKEELTYAHVRPAAEIYPEISTALQEAVEKIIVGDGEAAELVDAAYEKAMEEYGNLE
jgi:multiple sugar transport system substrate-binding protein